MAPLFEYMGSFGATAFTKPCVADAWLTWQNLLTGSPFLLRGSMNVTQQGDFGDFGTVTYDEREQHPMCYLETHYRNHQ